jgi:hypothetical protein
LILLIPVFGFKMVALQRENTVLSETVNLRNTPSSHEALYHRSLEKIWGILNHDRPSATHLISRAMLFVHDNSIHRMDAVHDRYAYHMPIILSRLLLSSMGEREQIPHLSCGPRALAMKHILQKGGITSRIVQVFSDNLDTIAVHMMLNVLNPDTDRWEVWDPSSRATYVDRETGDRLGIMSIVTGDKHRIDVKKRKQYRWDSKQVLYKAHFFNAVAFLSESGSLKNCLIFVNSDAFDLSKIYATNETFAQWTSRKYSHPQIITVNPQ